jgi:hypothetical protein
MAWGRRQKVVGLAAALFAVIALVVAVWVIAGGNRGDTAGDNTTAPTTTVPVPASPTTTTGSTAGEPSDTTAAGSTSLHVYFLSGEDLAVGGRTVPATRAVARAAMEQLLDGPDGLETDIGFTSSIPAGTELRGIALEDGMITVDLSAEFGAGGGSASMQSRVAQVVYTLTQFPTVDAVRFLMDGVPINALGGEGLVLTEPQGRADWVDWLPAILVESPTAGAPVTSPLRVTGLSLTFEATWRLEVVDGEGLIIAERAVTDGGGVEYLPFDQTVTFTHARPGLGAIVVSYESARDGTRVVAAEIPVRFGQV